MKRMMCFAVAVLLAFACLSTSFALIAGPVDDPDVPPYIDPVDAPDVDPDDEPEIETIAGPGDDPEVDPEIDPEVEPEVDPDDEPDAPPMDDPDEAPVDIPLDANALAAALSRALGPFANTADIAEQIAGLSLKSEGGGGVLSLNVQRILPESINLRSYKAPAMPLFPDGKALSSAEWRAACVKALQDAFVKALGQKNMRVQTVAEVVRVGVAQDGMVAVRESDAAAWAAKVAEACDAAYDTLSMTSPARAVEGALASGDLHRLFLLEDAAGMEVYDDVQASLKPFLAQVSLDDVTTTGRRRVYTATLRFPKLIDYFDRLSTAYVRRMTSALTASGDKLFSGADTRDLLVDAEEALRTTKTRSAGKVTLRVSEAGGVTLATKVATDMNKGFEKAKATAATKLNKRYAIFPLKNVKTRYFKRSSRGEYVTIATGQKAEAGHHLISFYPITDGVAAVKPKVQVLIKAGETLRVRVPIGEYRVTIDYGKDWYSAEYLFGPDGAYEELLTPLTVEKRGLTLPVHTDSGEYPETRSLPYPGK